jgi:hypothetical protein
MRERDRMALPSTQTQIPYIRGRRHIMSKLQSLAALREKAAKMGIDHQPYGKSRKKLQAAIAQSELAALALKSKSAGVLSWDTALKPKPKPKPKRPKPRGSGAYAYDAKYQTNAPSDSKNVPPGRRKSTKAVMDAHNYVYKKKPEVDGVPESKIPQGMKRVKYPNGYDPNAPKKRQGNDCGPRRMVCGHHEWWWGKEEKRCLQCFPTIKWRLK